MEPSRGWKESLLAGQLEGSNLITLEVCEQPDPGGGFIKLSSRTVCKKKTNTHKNSKGIITKF